MYDFHFGTKLEIEANEAKYLLFIKRMLPRWCNSIPDSEYIAIYNALADLPCGGQRPVLVETGSGASTIVLLNYAMKHNGVLYTWDTNGSKGSFLRSVCTETLVMHHGKNLFDHWKFIAYNSLSQYLGVGVLGEFGVGVDFCFLDSEHTLDVVLGELTTVNKFMKDNAIVAIDDANYNYAHTNMSYVNMLRSKLGLLPVANPTGNTCRPFFCEVEEFLRTQWRDVIHLEDSYKREFRADLFWSYYKSDRESMEKAGMEKMEDLEHRFDSWKVAGRK